MGVFGKNKEKDEDVRDKEKDTEQKDGGERHSGKVKRIKDINSENRKRRKEPIRSWTRLDRILVFILLLLTVGGSLLLTLSSRGYKLPDFPRIKLPNLALFGEKTVILESSNEDKKRAQGLMNGFNVLTKDLSGEYGIYVLDLNGSFTFGINENEVFQAESLMKLPVMLGMYMEEESGRIDLDTIYELKAKDKINGMGSLYGKPAGYKLTYRDMLKLIGKESDDSAYGICKRYLGDERINGIIDSIGMKDTNMKSNTTTAKDIGLFFYILQDGQFINAKNSGELLDNLTDTSYEEWLTLEIPQDIRVAHMFGRGSKVVNDAGIIYSDNPYIAVIISNNVNVSEADKVLPKISGIIYQEMN